MRIRGNRGEKRWRLGGKRLRSCWTKTCYSCFATTKYSCIKCGHSVCNHCSVFKDDEGTPGWVAGKSVGYCISCEKEEGASTNNGQEEKANSGQGMKTKSGLGETRSSGQREKTSSG